MSRFHSSAGIAIGPILFVLALLGILAAAMASSTSGFGSAGIIDRINADVTSQANLIRSKINECNLRCLTADASAGPPCPISGSPPTADVYPVNLVAGTADDVSLLTCPLDGVNIWQGSRAAQLPPPSQGMGHWSYMNAGNTGGRCIYSAPLNGNGSGGIVGGLQNAAKKFTNAELAYTPSGASQKFVVFLTPASGSVNAACAP